MKQFLILAAVLFMVTGTFAQRVLTIGTASTNTAMPATNEASPQTQTNNTFKMRPGEKIGDQQVMRISLTFKTNEYLFEQPETMRVIASPNFSAILVSKDESFNISIRFQDIQPADAKEELHQAALQACPDVDHVEEFISVAMGRNVPAIQLHQHQPEIPTRIIRKVWIPVNGGIMEVTLNSDSKAFSKAERCLSFVFVTMRSDEEGKLVVPVRTPDF
jgi:hypothetical protein